MEKIIIVLTLFLGVGAHAADSFPQTYEFRDPEIATVLITLRDVDVPLHDLLTISVLCVDRRRLPNSVKPTMHALLVDQEICAYRPRPHQYDETTKILTLHLSVSSPTNGQMKCDDHYRQPLDLRVACAAWQR